MSMVQVRFSWKKKNYKINNCIYKQKEKAVRKNIPTFRDYKYCTKIYENIRQRGKRTYRLDYHRIKSQQRGESALARLPLVWLHETFSSRMGLRGSVNTLLAILNNYNYYFPQRWNTFEFRRSSIILSNFSPSPHASKSPFFTLFSCSFFFSPPARHDVV